MAEHIELNPASHLTIDTQGEPGNRTFFIQGAQGSNVVTLVIEKMQAASLISGLGELLEEIAKNHPDATGTESESVLVDLRLQQPLEPLFRVGNMGLGYSEEVEKIVIVAYEITEEESDESNAVSFWASWSQVSALIPHTENVIDSGRPICGNCGQPMDPEGHFCAKKNGHKH